MSDDKWVWMVTDLSQPNHLGYCLHQYGPFEAEEAAREFAQMRGPYWAHDSRKCGPSI